MEVYFPLKMKRKDLEDVSDDFSDFSLSSPARKIRPLQSHRNRDSLAPFGPRLQKILSFEDVMPKVVAWTWRCSSCSPTIRASTSFKILVFLIIFYNKLLYLINFGNNYNDLFRFGITIGKPLHMHGKYESLTT